MPGFPPLSPKNPPAPSQQSWDASLQSYCSWGGCSRRPGANSTHREGGAEAREDKLWDAFLPSPPPFSWDALGHLLFLFLGCTPISSSFLSCGISSHLPSPPFEGYPLLLILFFYFLQGTLSQLLSFPGGTHASPSPFVGCACTSLFYPGSPHASAAPAALFFSGMHSHISSSFSAGCTPHLLLFLGCTPTSSSSFLQDTLKSISRFCGMNPWISSSFSGCTQASLLFPTPNLIHCQDQLLPGPLGITPCTSLRIPAARPAPKAHPEQPAGDVFGKRSAEGTWGREQSDSQGCLSMQPSQSNPTLAALI